MKKMSMIKSHISRKISTSFGNSNRNGTIMTGIRISDGRIMNLSERTEFTLSLRPTRGSLCGCIMNAVGYSYDRLLRV